MRHGEKAEGGVSNRHLGSEGDGRSRAASRGEALEESRGQASRGRANGPFGAAQGHVGLQSFDEGERDAARFEGLLEGSNEGVDLDARGAAGAEIVFDAALA